MEDLAAAGVCEVESCVQTSCAFLWSGQTLISLSLHSFSASWHVFLGGIRSQASVFFESCHASFSPFTSSKHLPVCIAAESCKLFKFSSVRPALLVRADKVKMKQICHLLWFALQSAVKFGIDFSCLLECFKCDFCLCDKCIIAPYFNYTKALFVWFKPPFPSLLFNDIVLYYVRDLNERCLIYHLSGIELHCESFKLVSACICEAFFQGFPFF